MIQYGFDLEFSCVSFCFHNVCKIFDLFFECHFFKVKLSEHGCYSHTFFYMISRVICNKKQNLYLPNLKNTIFTSSFNIDDMKKLKKKIYEFSLKNK